METPLAAGGQKPGRGRGAAAGWAPPGGVPPGPLAGAPGGRRQEPDMHHGPVQWIVAPAPNESRL
jgi:hypothetical protein